MTIIIKGVEYEEASDDSFELRCRKCGGIPEIEVFSAWGSPVCEIKCKTCKIIGNNYDIKDTEDTLMDRIRSVSK